MTWTAIVVEPRKSAGEKSLYILARERMANGKLREQRVSARTADPQEAERKRQEFLVDLNTPSGLTVLECMDRRIADLASDPNKSPHSVESFRCARRLFAEWLDVRAVDAGLVKRVRIALRDRGMGNGTINTYMSRAAASWRWCEDLGYVRGSWPRVRSLPRPPRKKRPYTPEEVESVLGWVKGWQGGRWYPIVLLIAETGRRVSEVCNLQARDVDLSGRTILVRLKGRAALGLPVSDEALGLLGPLVSSLPADACVFRGRKRGGGWGPQITSGVRDVVRRAVTAVGIPDGARLDVHSLRRSFAFDAGEAGLSDEEAMGLTGHETASMLHHYRKGGVTKDKREGMERVARYRAEKTGRTSTVPPLAPPEAVSASHGAATATAAQVEASASCTRPVGRSTSRCANDVCATGPMEGGAGSAEIPAVSSPAFRVASDRQLATACRWYAEDPATFRALAERFGLLHQEVIDAADHVTGAAPSCAQEQA